MSALLQVQGLSKAFAEFKAVEGVTFSLAPGTITAVIGPNGAGKTTLMNLITGKLWPDAGSIHFEGREVTRSSTHARVRAGMGRAFQVTNIFPRISMLENVALPLVGRAGRAFDLVRRFSAQRALHEEAEHLLLRVGLREGHSRLAGELSHGDRRLLEIAIALGTGPRFLLLDEPTGGMAAGERERVLAQIRKLAEDGLTLLLVEHDMDVVFGLARRVLVLHQGRLLAEGTPEQIRGDARVREVYLGERTSERAAKPPAARTQGTPLLEVERLDAGYGLAHVLHDVRFRVDQGEVVALLGRNGAGKTTTLRSLVNLTVPHRGSRVRLSGEDLAGKAPEEVAALGVGYVPDDRRIFPDLTVRENLKLPLVALGRRPGSFSEDRIGQVFPPLRALWERRGRHLSGGEQKMLAIARALMAEPRLLLLDEPSEGLSPLLVQLLEDALRTIRGEGVTLLLADQNLRFARGLADRALVMERGRIVHVASSEELAADPGALDRLLAV